MTFSFSWISSGVPSAIFSPKFRTTMRSEMFMTAGISCSTSRTVTPRLRDAAHHLHRPHGFVVVHAGEGLVEQQHGRVGGEADGNAERAQMAVRQRAGDLVPLRAEAEEVDDLVGGSPEFSLVAPWRYSCRDRSRQGWHWNADDAR